MAQTTVNTVKLELDDIQGLIIRSHKEHLGTTYLMLRVSDADMAKAWIGRMADRVNPASVNNVEPMYHLAFTWQGLLALGYPAEATEGFSVEFVQGMTTHHRARLLGDLGDSSAEHWGWGGSDGSEIHLLLMVYAFDPADLAGVLAPVVAELNDGGLELLHQLDTWPELDGKEHFGFKDGVSQPIIPGLSKKAAAHNMIPAGEFVLGYENAYEELPYSPLVPASWDGGGSLPDAVGQAGSKDLGKNGSYLVFRQLEQDVKGFWDFLREAVQRENPESGTDEAVALAAKMVGRWPDGTPLCLHPEGPVDLSYRNNDFLYAARDADGSKCPLGAHVRRSHPRDVIPDCSPKASIRISKSHRILRRGRSYGPPLVENLDPALMMAAPDDGSPRGLHFICFNTNISRQFEFIQHTWNDNSKFAGLYQDPDPILGIKDSRNKDETHDFTIQGPVLRRKVQGLKRFVHVKGGAYFFMPGIRALRFLSTFNPH